MPFTPFHMGPGMLIKALLQGSFSLMVFGWSQFIMDIQPLFVLLTGGAHMHGVTHTYTGATLLALLSAISGKYLLEFARRSFEIVQNSAFVSVSWATALLSGFVGTYSHVMLDSIMHLDIRPFYPFDSSNALLHMVSVVNLHKLCMYSGLLGAGLYFMVQLVQNKRLKKL